MNALQRLEKALASLQALGDGIEVSGAVSDIARTHCRVAGLSRFIRLGDCVRLEHGGVGELAEVVRIDRDAATLKPFGISCDALVGSRAVLERRPALSPHPDWKGRVIDALGRPIDGLGELPRGEVAIFMDREPIPALSRARVKRALRSGVRVIDIFTPLCAGQRIGVFAGSGVGKSSLLAMLAKGIDFDSVVIALVGERGREVREFLEEALKGARSSTVAIVSTGDESPMMRRLAPKTAMSVAEYFRDRGESVLLIMDSVTRFAHAARDVALAAGEPAVARGYAPSVFSELPRLLERAGPGLDGGGTITGVFSVLIDGDDHNDPVADCIRGTLDGHIVLDRSIADQGRYPAVNIPASVSRLAHHAWTPRRANLVGKLRELIARFEDTRDLRMMGGYVAGADMTLDHAMKIVPLIYETLQQAVDANLSLDAFQELADVLKGEAGAASQGSAHS